jgi:hypothetical protein
LLDPYLRRLEALALEKANHNDWATAHSAFKAIAIARPHEPGHYFNLAGCLTITNVGNPEGLAMIRFAEVLGVEKNGRFCLLAGRTLFWNGRLGEARPYLEDAARSSPDPDRARGMLARIVAWSRKWDVSENDCGHIELPPASSSVALFVVSDPVGLDHLVPIAWRWAQAENRHAIILIADSTVTETDYRICFLKNMKNIQTIWLSTLLGPRINLEAAIGPVLSREGDTVTSFDNSDDAFARILRSIVNRSGGRLIGIPHGEEPYVNLLTNEDATLLDYSRTEPGELYDSVALSGRFPIEKYGYRKFNAYRLLGSQRYCDEWLGVLDRIRPTARDFSLGRSKSGLKVVLFLPKPRKIVHWAELGRTIKLIASMPNLHLAVKRHPRAVMDRTFSRNQEGAWRADGTRSVEECIPDQFARGELGSGSTYELLKDDIESTELLAWADVFLALGTSICFEAIARDRPVLELSWCHGNLATVAWALPETDMRSRDQCLKTLKQLAEQESQDHESFYDEQHRTSFIRRFIDPGDGPVLDKWMSYFKEMAKKRRSDPS